MSDREDMKSPPPGWYIDWMLSRARYPLARPWDKLTINERREVWKQHRARGGDEWPVVHRDLLYVPEEEGHLTEDHIKDQGDEFIASFIEANTGPGGVAL